VENLEAIIILSALTLGSYLTSSRRKIVPCVSLEFFAIIGTSNLPDYSYKMSHEMVVYKLSRRVNRTAERVLKKRKICKIKNYKFVLVFEVV